MFDPYYHNIEANTTNEIVEMQRVNRTRQDAVSADLDTAHKECCEMLELAPSGQIGLW
jgi:hypothetical protein